MFTLGSKDLPQDRRALVVGCRENRTYLERSTSSTAKQTNPAPKPAMFVGYNAVHHAEVKSPLCFEHHGGCEHLGK